MSRTSAAESFRAIGEVDGLRRHHDADRARQADHERAFKAPIIAVNMPADASRQIQMLAPIKSSSSTCGRAATDLLFDAKAIGASSRRSTITGVKEKR